MTKPIAVIAKEKEDIEDIKKWVSTLNSRTKWLYLLEKIILEDEDDEEEEDKETLNEVKNTIKFKIWSEN